MSQPHCKGKGGIAYQNDCDMEDQPAGLQYWYQRVDSDINAGVMRQYHGDKSDQAGQHKNIPLPVFEIEEKGDQYEPPDNEKQRFIQIGKWCATCDHSDKVYSPAV